MNAKKTEEKQEDSKDQEILNKKMVLSFDFIKKTKIRPS